MSITTNDLKTGITLALDDGLFQVIDFQHVKPGKGKAFVRTKLRNLDSGGVVDRTFRAGEKVEQAIIDRRDFQYLYHDDRGYHFMDLETYEQRFVGDDLIGDASRYMSEGSSVVLPVYQGSPIGIDLPAAVELEVTKAEPGVKGDRASGATKPVTLETGLEVQTPLFVEEGDRIKVSTSDGSYITRVS